MGVDLIYRARVGTFIYRNARGDSNVELQKLEKKRRHCVGSDVNLWGDGNTNPYSADDIPYDGCVRTLLPKYRLEQQLMMENPVTYMVDIEQMLLLISGDIEENPGPLTQGELGAYTLGNHTLGNNETLIMNHVFS